MDDKETYLKAIHEDLMWIREHIEREGPDLESEKLVKYARALKVHCKLMNGCRNCGFCSGIFSCEITGNNPRNWEI